MSKYKSILPDTIVIVEALISREMESGELEVEEVVIAEPILAELEYQASKGLAKGTLGLDEIGRIVSFSHERGFAMRFVGERPTRQQIERSDEINTLVRQLAQDEGVTFVTQDKVQAKISRAKGADVHLVMPTDVRQQIELESFFGESIMSVHLREGAPPVAKRGSPGAWEFIELDPEPMDREAVKRVSAEIVEVAGQMKDGFVEIERPGSTIVQLGSYRVVITRPPFSDSWEITAVRPVRHLRLSDYDLSEKLIARIDHQAEGVLIAGSPGMGKTTFAAALIEYYAEKNRIVKTIEAPRDLVLADTITQYSISHGTQEEIHDVLLLSRPDYALFDEMRNVKDFMLYADLRLSGIGLAGVMHATKAIDAIHRLIGKVELGMIPQIVDTVIFIHAGKVHTVLALHMTVKVPHGMTEDDLARPVVVVSNFETNEPVYELYTFGEQTMVVPVSDDDPIASAHLSLAAETVREYFSAYSPLARAQMLSDRRAAVYLPDKAISAVIGKAGSNIQRIEKELGIGLDIRRLEELDDVDHVDFDLRANKTSVAFQFDSSLKGRSIDILVEGDTVMSAQIGRDATVKVSKRTKVGKLIERAYKRGDVSVVLDS